MIELILSYWYLAPTVISVATIIAKATPNETDNKIVAVATKVVDVLAIHANPTKFITR